MKRMLCHFILAATLLPVLCWADNAEKQDRWEPFIAAFEKLDADKMPPKGLILFVGSSSIRLWKEAEAFPEYTTLNRGFGGSMMSDVNQYFDRIVSKYEPRQIVLYEGDNDIDSGKEPDEVFADYTAFFERVHKELPKTRITIMAIKPSPKRWELVDKMREVNTKLSEVAKSDPLIDFVDVDAPSLGPDGKPREELFTGDKLHLNADGYAVWNDVLRPYLTPEPAKK